MTKRTRIKKNNRKAVVESKGRVQNDPSRVHIISDEDNARHFGSSGKRQVYNRSSNKKGDLGEGERDPNDKDASPDDKDARLIDKNGRPDDKDGDPDDTESVPNGIKSVPDGI